MDLNALMGTLLSGDSIANMSQLTGASQKEVKSVLSSALPQLLNGAQAQANDAGTAEGFVNALAQHAQTDTSNVGAFLQNVDMADGAKIVGHLLGSQQASATQEAAQRAGISANASGQILSAAAPLLMSLLGQQTSGNQNNNAAGIGGLLGSLLGGGGGGLLASLLGAQPEASATGKKKKGKKKEEESGGLSGLADILTGLLK